MSVTGINGGAFLPQVGAAAASGVVTDLRGIDVWIRPQAGSDNNLGTYDSPFATFSGMNAVGAIVPGITIGLSGVLKENFVAPAINDVRVVGYANQPRQATSGGVPNGGGATWMNPGTVASALVTLGSLGTDNGQAWQFENIFFGQAGAAPNVIATRTVAGGDSSHCSFYNCVFTAPGVAAGIGLSCGEIIKLIVRNCQFYDFNGAAAYGIRANIAGGIANPPYLQWQLTGNTFVNNVNNLVGALRNASITGNTFESIGRTQTTTISIGLTGGANNTVMGNFIGDQLTGATASFTGGTTDKWCNYYSDDGCGSGVPS
jgi:hypothetical protein